MPELEIRSTNGLREGNKVDLQMLRKFGWMDGKGIQLFALVIAKLSARLRQGNYGVRTSRVCALHITSWNPAESSTLLNQERMHRHTFDQATRRPFQLFARLYKQTSRGYTDCHPLSRVPSPDVHYILSFDTNRLFQLTHDRDIAIDHVSSGS
jgi:hypothetical protein